VIPEPVKEAFRAIGRVIAVDDAPVPGRAAIGMPTGRPTVPPSPVPRWLAPFVDAYFVDHAKNARALKEGRVWDAQAEEREFDAIIKLIQSGEDEEVNALVADYPNLMQTLVKYRKKRKILRKAREDTYPDVNLKKMAWGPSRVMEKMGMYPRVDGDATYAQFMEYLERREVTRVLLYDEGNTAIVETGGPGSHLDPKADVIRWKVQIPGDAHDEVTRACKRAFFTKPINPDDMFTPHQTSCQLFMNIKPWNMAIHGARNWLMAGTFFFIVGAIFQSAYQADRSADVLRKRAQIKKQQNERDALADEMGRSKAKKLKKNQSKVRFSDVAGQDMVVSEFQTIIDIMKGDPRYKNKSVEPPKGILLEGPPGTGKTLLAKAVAGEAGLPFFYANGSEFVEMFVGVAASRMRSLFKRARLNAPSIIFIDELDTIGRSRNAGEFRDSSTSEREQGLMQMLVEMDGFDNKETSEAVLVIGATNLATQLDPALLRSGRFDRVYHIGVPSTAEGRMPILQVHARSLNIPRGGDEKYESDAFLHRVADLTTGFSGAELANLLNEAAILSVRKDKEMMDITDIEGILEKQAIGLISAPLEDGWGKEHLAIIEAAKAVLYCARQNMAPELLQVSIRPRGSQMSGVILTDRSPESESEIHANDGPDTLAYYVESLGVMLAGRCAEYHFFGPDGISIRTNDEVCAAVEMAFDVVTTSGLYPDKRVIPMLDPVMLHQFKIPREGMEEGTRDVMVRAHARGVELVKEYEPLIQRVAADLLENERVYGSVVREMVKQYNASRENVSKSPTRADEIALEA
jgi:cell division protease FtsH